MDISSINPNGFAEALSPTQPTERLAEHRELIEAVKAIEEAQLFGQDNELTFVFDRETRRPVLRIINRVTKEVIRQIPPELALRMAEEVRLADKAEFSAESG